MKLITKLKMVLSFITIFGGIGAAFGLAAAGAPIAGGAALIGCCFAGAYLASSSDN